MDIKHFLSDLATRIERVQHGYRTGGDSDILHQNLNAVRDRIHDGLATIEVEEAEARQARA